MEKLETIDYKTIKENLEYSASNLQIRHIQEGRRWYKESHRIAKNMHGFYEVLDVDKIAQLIAIFSANMPWHRNLIEVHHFLLMVKLGRIKGIENNRIYQSKANYLKAMPLLDGKDVFIKRNKAKKTYSFYNNIMLNSDFCTIDTHHIKAMVSNTKDWKKILSNKGIYEDLEAITKEVLHKYSLKYGLNLYQFQASLWVLIREQYDTFKHNIKSVDISTYSKAQIN